MKSIDSQALGVLNKALGLTGSGSPRTELLDGHVDQVLDVGRVVRRGRTLAGSGGLFFGVMQNVHGAANSLTTTVNPFAIAAGLSPPFPSPIPSTFDLWLIGAAVIQSAGVSTISAMLELSYPAENQAWGVNNSGGDVLGAFGWAVAYWDTIVSESQDFALLGASGLPQQSIRQRLPRHPDTTLAFHSTSSAVATFNCRVTLGLFPVSLGQDAAI